MELTLQIVLPLLWAAGLVLILPGLGGIWVIVLANLAGKIIFPELFGAGGWIYVIVAIFMAGFSELLDVVFGALGAKKAKASKNSIILSLVLAIILGVLMTSLFPVIGSLAGVFLGSFLGVFLGEIIFYKKDTAHASRAGLGALVGRIFSVFTKLGFALTIITYGIMRLYFF